MVTPGDFNNQRVVPINKKNENFSETAYPVGYGSPFGQNSRSNDYFYDRTGMKGSVFTIPTTNPIYKLEDVKTNPPLSQLQVMYKLEMYPEDMYQECVSDFKQSKLKTIKYKPNNLMDYLTFKKGVLVKSTGEIPMTQQWR